MIVTDAIRHHARVRPYDQAVIHPTGSATYLQLAVALSELSLKLRSHGVHPGMTVAIYATDPFLHLCLALAAMLNGTVSISAHPNYDPIPPNVKVDAYLIDHNLPFTPPATLIPVGANWIGEVPRDAQPVMAGTPFSDEHAVCRMYTSSGTTGLPKVIGHSSASQHIMVTNGLAMDPMAQGPNLSMMGLSTIGGFGTATTTLWHGATLVLATAPLMVLRALSLYGVRSLRASPQQLQGLVEMVRGRPVQFPRLQKIEVGGASTPPSVILAARATLCTNVMGIYGSTEAGLVAVAPAAVLHAHPDAAGYVVPGVQVRVVDDAGLPVEAGAEGVIQIRAPGMIRGYLGDEQATAEAFHDDWFIPGDLGVLRADGLLHIRGRVDEMINAGGVKLSPSMVDEFLLTQPGVRDAATFAFRQTGRHDQVWAAVVCGPDFNEPAVLAACRARLNSRAPVRLIPMVEIPRNAMGKAMRQQLSANALLA